MSYPHPNGKLGSRAQRPFEALTLGVRFTSPSSYENERHVNHEKAGHAPWRSTPRSSGSPVRPSSDGAPWLRGISQRPNIAALPWSASGTFGREVCSTDCDGHIAIAARASPRLLAPRHRANGASPTTFNATCDFNASEIRPK